MSLRLFFATIRLSVVLVAIAAAFALVLAPLAGCTTIPANPADMTPEQLKAVAVDKNLTGSCVIARNLSGTVAMVFVNLDKTSIKTGSMTVEPGSDCKTTIFADPPAKPASAP